MSPGCAALGSLLNEGCLVLPRSFLSDFVLLSRNKEIYGEVWFCCCAPIYDQFLIDICFDVVAIANNKKNENHSLDSCWQAAIGLAGVVSTQSNTLKLFLVQDRNAWKNVPARRAPVLLSRPLL